MEYANDEIFNIRYNEKENCLEDCKKKGFIRRHKFLSMAIMATIILIVVNGVLIYEFFDILSLMNFT